MVGEQDQFQEYVGRPYEDVVAKLKERYPENRFQPVAIGSFVTKDIRHDRIRVWYKKETGIVARCEQR
jgi:hypothetical protein